MTAIDLERWILNTALKAIYGEIDLFILSISEGDEFKTPNYGDVMRLKALLPPGYCNSFSKEIK